LKPGGPSIPNGSAGESLKPFARDYRREVRGISFARADMISAYVCVRSSPADREYDLGGLGHVLVPLGKTRAESVAVGQKDVSHWSEQI